MTDVLSPVFSRFSAVPEANGLYDPRQEKDACGLAMVATLRGYGGHDIIAQALEALRHLEHRGAVGSDAGTGDGAGILTQIPDRFLREETDIDLPPMGEYGVGLVFLPADSAARVKAKATIERIADDENLRVLGWRAVPTRPEVIGELARSTMPAFEQLFVAHRGDDSSESVSGIALDRLLFRLRKRAEH